MDDLPKLQYTEMMFQEALRLYPPAWIITRKALDDDEIDGYRIPKGALVVTSPYVTQRMPDLWPEPEAFGPERFSAGGIGGAAPLRLLPVRRRAAAVHRQRVRDGRGGRDHRHGRATVRCRLTSRPGQPIAVEPGVTLRPKHGLDDAD